MITRSQAREIALHLIFEMTFQPLDADALQSRLSGETHTAAGEELALYAEDLTEQQVAYIRAAVEGVARERDALDQQIAAYAKGWKLNRLSRMTGSILRLALYEMQKVKDVPVGVAINEAVRLAKKYDTQEAAAFINGILGTYARSAKSNASSKKTAKAAETANG